MLSFEYLGSLANVYHQPSCIVVRLRPVCTGTMIRMNVLKANRAQTLGQSHSSVTARIRPRIRPLMQLGSIDKYTGNSRTLIPQESYRRSV